MRSREKLLRRLRAAPPFTRLSEETLRRLLACARIEERPRGAVLFREGAQAEFVHFVLEGSIGLAGSAEKPEGTIVEIFRECETFVAPAAILRLPYLVSAVVLAPARVLAIPAAVFRSVLDNDLGLARGMTDVLARHWRLLVEQLKDLKLRSAAERLAVYLLGLAAGAKSRHPALLDLREPRKALAARLNMTPENLSRAFVVLRSHGVSNAGKTSVRIENVARLRAFAYGGTGRLAKPSAPGPARAPAAPT
jgi:CRP/FNR family transcriptional activator FtrB